jgi:hypothetical protein
MSALEQNDQISNMKLAVAMSKDGCCFVYGNSFEDDRRMMQHCEMGLELTGRVAEKRFFMMPVVIKRVK